MIEKVAVRNYRLFRTLDLAFSPGMNILVGANDTGKSTLIEAITLALTGRLHARPLIQELSPYLINLNATRDYVAKLQAGTSPPPTPPELIVEVFLRGSNETEILRGTNNLAGEDACGLRLQATLSPDFYAEYQAFVAEPANVKLVPTEYYRVDWVGFSGNAVTARSVPAAASVIDSTAMRLQPGVDFHLQQIIRTHLEPRERVELSRQYRSLREEFSEKPAVKKINKRLEGDSADLSDRHLSLSIDLSQRNTWESGLVAHLDEIPFPFIGKGEQNTLKTLLAIDRRTEDVHIVLIEEPEIHLSFASLRRLLPRIEAACGDKQVIVATHSTYVLNKLGLQNLVLLGEGGSTTRITDVPADTVEYFKKLAGFDTLRLVLAAGAILVEGPSDELVVQRAYRDTRGKLPIDDGIDVISVGLSHKRFLDLAVRLNRRAWVVTDNDGKTLEQIRERFAPYLDSPVVSLHVGADPSVKTLEAQIVAANDLATLNRVLVRDYQSAEEALASMLSDKTGTALSIFESEHSITMPAYIQSVVHEQ
ncbi:MAG: AAA family ATPase [Myxococcota bacterium]|nr:AAA family ATPase [Myxococcota bacterium]